MDQPIRDQTHDVQRAIAPDRVVHRRIQREVVKEGAGLDLVIDMLDVCAQDATRTHDQMTDVRIPHHPLRQAHAFPRSFNQRVRIFFEEFAIVRHLSLRDVVAFALSAIAKYLENDQYEWRYACYEISLP